MSWPCARTQASASCDAVAPRARPGARASSPGRGSSRSFRGEARHVLPHVVRGEILAPHDPAAQEAAAERLYGTKVTPRSRQASRTPLCSGSRTTARLGLQRRIGCTAHAFASVAALTSERPSARTLPSRTRWPSRRRPPRSTPTRREPVQVVHVDRLHAEAAQAGLELP